MTTEAALRDLIVRYGKSMFERGLTFGSSGNISARRSMAGRYRRPTWRWTALDPARLARLHSNGRLAGHAPTKETFLHIATYRHGRTAAPSCICIPPIPSPYPACRRESRGCAAAGHGLLRHARRQPAAGAIPSARRPELWPMRWRSWRANITQSCWPIMGR